MVKVEQNHTINGTVVTKEFGAKVFDREKRKCYKNLMVTHNDRVFNQGDGYDQLLQDGDKVMVMPLYAGG